MVHKEHIENFLRINKIPLTAPDSEIREALIYAKWHEKDVEVALLTLRGNVEEDPQVTAAHALLRTDAPLKPETLASLLGMDIQLARGMLPVSNESEAESSSGSIFIMVIASMAFAFAAALTLMYIFQIGPFFSPIEQSLF